MLAREFFRMLPKILIGFVLLVVMTIPVILSYPRVVAHVHELVSQGLARPETLQRIEYPVFLGDQVGVSLVRFISVIVIFVTVGLISKEVSSGTIKVLLSFPTSRLRIYTEKAAAAVASIAILDILIMIIIFVVSGLVREPLSVGQVASITLTLFAGHFFVTGFALFQSSLFDNIVKPAIITMLLLVIMPSFFRVGNARYFYYETYISITDAAVSGHTMPLNLAILFLVGIFFFSLGLLVFRQRSF
jgi:ABC-2 type transport system permease protein